MQTQFYVANQVTGQITYSHAANPCLNEYIYVVPTIGTDPNAVPLMGPLTHSWATSDPANYPNASTQGYVFDAPFTAKSIQAEYRVSNACGFAPGGPTPFYVNWVQCVGDCPPGTPPDQCLWQTGILPDSTDLIVSPNPASDAIAVEVVKKDGGTLTDGWAAPGARRIYEVYSLDGRVVRQGVYSGPRNVIDLAGLPAGSYSLIVRESNKLISRKTFIKQ